LLLLLLLLLLLFVPCWFLRRATPRARPAALASALAAISACIRSNRLVIVVVAPEVVEEDGPWGVVVAASLLLAVPSDARSTLARSLAAMSASILFKRFTAV